MIKYNKNCHFNLFKSAILRHCEHAYCYAAITIIHFHLKHELFSSCRTGALCPFDKNSPSPCPQTQAASVLLSVFVHVTSSGTSCAWNHTVFVLCLPYFTKLKIHPCQYVSEFSSFVQWNNIHLYI